LRTARPPISAAKDAKGLRQSRAKADQKLSNSMSLRRSAPSKSVTRTFGVGNDVARERLRRYINYRTAIRKVQHHNLKEILLTSFP
jgi:hypothetical protein